MRLAVEHHVLVDLVRDHEQSGLDRDRLEPSHVGIRQGHAARVVRRVDQDCPGAGGDRSCDRIPVDAKCVGHRDADRDATGQLDIGQVAVVGRLDHDDFVARAHDRQDRGEDGLCGAGGDRDFGIRIVVMAVERGDLGADGLSQRRNAGHRRVLIEALAHRARHRVDQCRIAVKIGKALSEIDRLVLGGQCRHHGKDGGAHLGQLRFEGGRGQRGRCVHGEVPQG